MNVARMELYLEMVEGVGESVHVALEDVGEVEDLLLRVENFDVLSVGVVANGEGTVEGLGVLADLLLGVFEGLGDEVDGLVGGDGVGSYGSDGRIEGEEFRLVRKAVFEFTEGGEETSTVGADRAVFLGETELYGEPVNRGELGNVIVGSAKGGEANLLGEVSERGVGEEGHVTENLVTEIRLRGVERLGRVAEVLCGMEDAEGEASKEVARAQKASDGAETPPGAILQEL